MGLIPVVTPKPLALGTCTHEGLAAHYSGLDFNEGLEKVNARSAYMVPTARKILNAYMAEYAHERLNVLYVEEEFEVRLKGHVFTRRLDLGIEHNGKHYVNDHKTAGDQNTRLASVKHDPSLFTQELVARALSKQKTGLPYGGMILNLIGTREPYRFQRVPLSWPPGVVQSTMFDLYHVTVEMEESEERYGSPWNFPRSWQCQGRYSLCEYLPLCLYGKEEVCNFDREEVF